MGRFLLCGREAALPYEVEALDLRLYSIEELCCFIYDNLSLIDEDFIDGRLLAFIREELGMEELAARLEGFTDPGEQDEALFLILKRVGYHTETELKQFSERLSWRKNRTSPEKLREKADMFFERKRFNSAVRSYRALLKEGPDMRMNAGFYEEVKEALANAYGHLSEFDNAEQVLGELYRETGSERILKKLYDVFMLAGDGFPAERYRKYETLFASWQQDFEDRVRIQKERIAERPEVKQCPGDGPEAAETLKNFTDRKKEEYRSMLE